MTDPRGGRGFDPERMRTQFDRLWATAMESLEDLREVVVKASQTAKVKLDATFLRRERDRLFQQLGEETYRHVEAGELRPTKEMRDTLDRINALVEQIAKEEARERAMAEEEADEGEAGGPSEEDEETA